MNLLLELLNLALVKIQLFALDLSKLPAFLRHRLEILEGRLELEPSLELVGLRFLLLGLELPF